MRMIAGVIDGLVNIKNPKASWLDDPYLFQQAKSAVNAAFDLIGPQAAVSAEAIPDLGGRMQGRVRIHEFLRDLQIANPAIPRARQTARERALLMMKTDLGDLAERARPYGRSAAQLRVEAELAPLWRKVRKNPDDLTAAENRQFLNLVKRLDDLNAGKTKTTESAK
jgi:hypothetical protein